jgi:hypothetical protein
VSKASVRATGDGQESILRYRPMRFDNKTSGSELRVTR